MQQQNISRLYNKEASTEFYEEQYFNGYLTEWQLKQKNIIFEIIQSLELPPEGKALDFGCGNGVLTDILKKALPPDWKVYGADISKTAIENAKRQNPNCIFFVANDKEFLNKKFDLVFSHHVLEHVYNLSQVLDEIINRLKDNSAMLHILPCGNEGSFTHNICLLRKDGIDRQHENRLFFENETHVRTLTSDQLSTLCGERGFLLKKEFYSNQYYGAIDGIISTSAKSIVKLTDVSMAVNKKAKKRLNRLRFILLFLWALRKPAIYVDNKLRKKSRTLRDNILLTIGLPLYIFSKPIDFYFKRKASNEWHKRKTERNGSEMYLLFKRAGTA